MGIWSDFESEIDGTKWYRPHGGVVSSSAVCGVAHEENSLVFEGLGTRKLQTKSMDTTNTRFIKIKHYGDQFYFK